MTAAILPLLQLCDSLFPIGAFSHSDGLETATDSGQVATVSDLAAWMSAVCDESLRTLEGPAVAGAWRACGADDDVRLLTWDDELYAMRPAAAGRDAMRTMGARLLKTWQYIRPHVRVEHATTLRPRMTFPVAFGVVASAAGVAEPDTVAGYAYSRLAATLSAAMRLMPIGQHEGHRLLAAQTTRIAEVVECALTQVADEASMPMRSFMPAVDIAAMRQQHVHSRLFRS